MATKTPKFKFEAEKLARALPVLVGVLAVGLLLGAYVTFFMPKIGRLVPGGQYDAAPYETAVRDEKEYQAKLTAQITKFEALNPVQREKALNLVTTEVDFPGLLVQLSEICTRHQAACPSIDVVQDETVLAGNRRSARMSLNVTGSDYAGMKSFLADLERSRRLFDVESLIFTPGSQSFSVSLRAYYLAGSSTAPAAAKPAGEESL
jgi:hypothetical protein